MTDERQDQAEQPGGPGDSSPPADSGRPSGDPPGDRPAGDAPGGGRPDERSAESRPDAQPQADRRGGPPRGGAPYRGAPGGKPYGGGQGGKPYGGGQGKRSYGGNQRGRPHGGKPGGRPYPDQRGPRPRPDQAGRPRSDGPPGRPPASHQGGHGGPPQYGSRPPGRRVDFSRQDRPRPSRGPWDRDRGPQRPRRDWDRRDQHAPPGPGPGLSPSEVLGEDEEIVAGRRPVEEAFSARREAVRLLVVPERRAALDQLVLHATTLRIPVVEVEGGTITAVTGFDGHQGIALVVAPRRWATLDEVLALARSRNEPPFLLALDHLEDPQNVGTLLRSAEACGVHGVVFPTKGAAPISPAAIKTSAGAVEHLLLVPLPDLASGLVDLHARGVRVIGADGDAPMTVREADLRGPVVIVTGSEGRGLNARVRKRVDLMARIPMRGKVASLNASVAGSVFLFEAAAQRELPEAVRKPETAAAPEPDPPQVPADTTPDAPPAVEAEGPSVEAIDGVPDASDATAPESSTASVSEADDLLPEAPPTPAGDRD